MKFKTQPELYLVLDRIRSLYNVGSLFRTADAFGVKKIYLCGYTGTPPRKEISKVALGAEQTVPWEKRGQAWKVVEDLKAKGVYIVALEQTKQSIPLSELFKEKSGKSLALIKKKLSFEETFSIALIVGNEVNGISRGTLERADAIVEIPMLGVKESLNVVVATGVALYAVQYGDFIKHVIE